MLYIPKQRTVLINYYFALQYFTYLNSAECLMQTKSKAYELAITLWSHAVNKTYELKKSNMRAIDWNTKHK